MVKQNKKMFKYFFKDVDGIYKVPNEAALTLLSAFKC